MMKNKKGFTLIELLAVIAILGIIISIATTSVIKGMNDSKEKTKYLAAKEITELATSYDIPDSECISVLELIYDEYLDKDVTNPRTGDNGAFIRDDKICKSENYVLQNNYKINEGAYSFDGYKYVISTEPITDDQYYLLGDVNMDGKITDEDSSLINEISVGSIIPNGIQKILADVNMDGKINAIDASKILIKIGNK